MNTILIALGLILITLTLLFLLVKAAEFIAEHGAKILKIAIIISIVFAALVAIHIYYTPIPGMNHLESLATLINKIGKA
jgi:hypothetical protein